MIDEKHYDIILLDLMMPGISGLDVLVHLKAIIPIQSCYCDYGLCYP